MPIVSYVRIKLKIPDIITDCEFPVARNLVYDLVMWVNLFKKMGASIDLNQDQLSPYGRKAIVSMTHTRYPANVLVAEPIKIPAHAEAMIPVLLPVISRTKTS